jgi:hypothetical protein
MVIKSELKFTMPAAKLWLAIPLEEQKKLLSSVWCAKCGHGVIIINYSGAVKSGELLLVGKCAECGGDVAKEIEANHIEN